METKTILKNRANSKKYMSRESHLINLVKKILLPVLAILFVSVMLTACGNNNSALIGRWEHVSGSISGKPEKLEFLKNGTGICDGSHSVTWNVENKRLILISTLYSLACNYEVLGSELTLSYDDGTSAIFKKEGQENENIIMEQAQKEDKMNPMNSPGYAVPE